MSNLVININCCDYPILELPNRPKAFLDRVIAKIYGVETKRVNEAVNRNPKKFPEDFYFELSEEETEVLKSQSATLDSYGFRRAKPKAFSVFGCNMLATILQSDVAIRRSVEIVRGFTLLESSSQSFDSLWKTLNNISERLSSHNHMLMTLTEEMYLNRSDINELRKRVIPPQANVMDQLDEGIISKNQLEQIKKQVQQKKMTKSEVLRCWSKFKRHFQIPRYSQLPKSRFTEAMKWLEIYSAM